MTWVWVGLVLALVVMLVLFAIALFRKLLAVVQAFSDLVGTTARLDGVHRAEPEARPEPAVLAGRAAASSRWSVVSQRRRDRRDQRHEARLARGRALVRADVAARWTDAR